MTLPADRIGYQGQLYAIVVDDAERGGPRVLGWSNDNARPLDALNAKPTWSNARYVRCATETGLPFDEGAAWVEAMVFGSSVRVTPKAQR